MRIIVFTFILQAWLMSTLVNATVELSEAQIKAAYLFNFARFSEWPKEVFENANQPFRFCILANAAVADSLKNAISTSLKNHPVSVESKEDSDVLIGCQVVYYGSTSKQPDAKTLQTLAQKSSLVVSDVPEIGTIRFVSQDQKVKFVVNLNSAKQANISLSAQLLKVAVRTEGTQD